MAYLACWLAIAFLTSPTMAVRIAPATPPPTACPTSAPIEVAARAGNGIAERADVEILRARAHRIAADRAGYQLDDEIDDRP